MLNIVEFLITISLPFWIKTILLPSFYYFMLYFIIFEKKEYDLSEKDFVNLTNKKIIKAINKLKLARQEVSILSISNILQKKEIKKYLSNLGNYVIGSTADGVYNSLKELTKKRETVETLKEAEKGVMAVEDIDLYIEKLIYKLQRIEMQTQKEEDFVSLVVKTSELIEKNLEKKENYDLYTGFFGLDALTDGLHNGELTIVGARPGVGKTTFALQIAEKIAKYNKKVAYVSLEMSEEQIIQKILSRRARINSRKIRNGDLTTQEIEKIGLECGKISELNLRILTKASSIQQIEIEARKLKNRGELDLLIIDYLQLVRNLGNFRSREQEVADISRTLKLLSLELEIPIIALCQLNRNARRNDPTLADIRESGSIEQDADNVIFLYQEDVESGIVTVDLQTQRAGNTGKAALKFNKALSEFIDVER